MGKGSNFATPKPAVGVEERREELLFGGRGKSSLK